MRNVDGGRFSHERIGQACDSPHPATRVRAGQRARPRPRFSPENRGFVFSNFERAARRRIAVSELPNYELVGPADAPVVVALGGISASRHVTSTNANAAPGWWEDIAGPGRAIDTTRVRVLGIDYIDGGRGSDG